MVESVLALKQFECVPSYLNEGDPIFLGIMPQVYYIVYARPPVKTFSGILGDIDLHCIWFLLSGGKTIIDETYDGSDPIGWYKNVLEEQEMFVKETKQQKFKGSTYIWLEIDTERTAIHEFTSWKELDTKDTETLAWRPFWVPCEHGTTKECLGFAVPAKEFSLSKKTPLMLQTVLDAILIQGQP